MVNLAEDAGSGFYKIYTNWKKAGFNKPSINPNRRENFFRIVFNFQPISQKALSWDQVHKVLELCGKPLLIAEIMGALDWKHRTKFRNKFIHPLLETELIEMTIPDKPQSPNQ